MKLRLQEYTGQLIVPDPLFALVQREAVERSGERNIITDSNLLWTIGDANESKYPLFYSSERTAECALDRINDVALRVGCFASKSELEDSVDSGLEEHLTFVISQPQGERWA